MLRRVMLPSIPLMIPRVLELTVELLMTSVRIDVRQFNAFRKSSA
jgi:hypothetical protein